MRRGMSLYRGRGRMESYDTENSRNYRHRRAPSMEGVHEPVEWSPQDIPSRSNRTRTQYRDHGKGASEDERENRQQYRLKIPLQPALNNSTRSVSYIGRDQASQRGLRRHTREPVASETPETYGQKQEDQRRYPLKEHELEYTPSSARNRSFVTVRRSPRRCHHDHQYGERGERDLHPSTDPTTSSGRSLHQLRKYGYIRPHQPSGIDEGYRAPHGQDSPRYGNYNPRYRGSNWRSHQPSTQVPSYRSFQQTRKHATFSEIQTENPIQTQITASSEANSEGERATDHSQPGITETPVSLANSPFAQDVLATNSTIGENVGNDVHNNDNEESIKLGSKIWKQEGDNCVEMAPALVAPQVGPHPGHIEPAQAYIFQYKIDENLAKVGMTEARDDHVRLQGIAWIEAVQKALKLPLKTYIAACILYHKFRLVHNENEYLVADAAAACLFQACKIQDTHKKSKEILCAAYNLRVPLADNLTPDDPVFEIPSKNVVGLERLILESARFDFRVRDPTPMTMKISIHVCKLPKELYYYAWSICRDLHRTWAPLKQTRNTIAIASTELAVRLCDGDLSAVTEEVIDYKRFSTTRAEVMETIIDALDLYTHHRAQTVVGPKHELETFINIRIIYNQEMAAKNLSRFTRLLEETDSLKSSNGVKTNNGESTAPTSTSAVSTNSSSQTQNASASSGTSRQGGTLRFMLDANRASEEQIIVDRYYRDEEEEYEVEVPATESRPESRGENRNERPTARARR